MGLVGRDFAGSWVRLGRVLLNGSGTSVGSTGVRDFRV